MWSACGRLSVAMEILGKAFLQKEAGEQLSPPLGDSYALAQILLQDFHSSHFTHVPPSPCIRPFYLFPSLYSLEFLERRSFFYKFFCVADRKFTHL